MRIKALSPGWRASFEALLGQANRAGGGNAGLAPAAASHPAAPGFRPLIVTAIETESADVISLTMEDRDHKPLADAQPGQYVVLRLRPIAGVPALFRSYSLSGPLSKERYRISVKMEPNGAGGKYLHEHVRVGDTLDVSSPRGSFVLQPGDGPVVLLSAGIGVTPVLAMLHALAAAGSKRQVLWLYTARDGEHHPFAAEVRSLMPVLAHGRSYVCYSRPGAGERKGQEFDKAGHIARSVFDEAGVNRDADVYLCGPNRFMADMKEALVDWGVAAGRIHEEVFSGGESMMPGVVRQGTPAPHVPKDEASTGPLVSFARSGIAAHWNAAAYQSILELAEACDVPVRWSCRTGVCHNCESGLVSGNVSYDPEPLDPPADGNVLVCCSRPAADVVVDL